MHIIALSVALCLSVSQPGLRFAWPVMCAEILPDDQLSPAYWECNNRLLIKPSHSFQSL